MERKFRFRYWSYEKENTFNRQYHDEVITCKDGGTGVRIIDKNLEDNGFKLDYDSLSYNQIVKY